MVSTELAALRHGTSAPDVPRASTDDAADRKPNPGVRRERARLNGAMERYAQGETSAFSTVYELLAPRLRAFLLKQGCLSSLADDLVQQAFLCIHRGRGRYAPGRDAVPWAFAIVRRLYVDHWRRTRNETCEHEMSCVAPDRSDPEYEAIATEMVIHLQQRLSRLPATQRLAFELVKLNGLTVAQAAGRLGTSEAGIKLRLHRAQMGLKGQ